MEGRRQHFASLEDQRIAQRISEDEWARYKGDNVSRSRTLRTDARVARTVMTQEEAHAALQREMAITPLREIEARDAALCAKLRAMESQDLLRKEEQERRDGLLAERAQMRAAMDRRVLADKDARIARALQEEGERADRARLKAIEESDADIVRKLHRLEADEVHQQVEAARAGRQRPVPTQRAAAAAPAPLLAPPSHFSDKGQPDAGGRVVSWPCGQGSAPLPRELLCRHRQHLAARARGLGLRTTLACARACTVPSAPSTAQPRGAHCAENERCRCFPIRRRPRKTWRGAYATRRRTSRADALSRTRITSGCS